MAIIGFILLDYFTVSQIYAKPERQLWGTLTAVGAIIQIFSYVMVAISNPGIITKADFDTEGE
jgi:DMSO reductase anchor subunit